MSKDTIKILLYTVPALGLLVCTSGCASMGASSASSGSISSLSASSMAGAAAHPAYDSDVRMIASSAIESGASESEVLRSVGRVAAEHGVSDWEVQASTYVALGEGLRIGGADEDHVRVLAPKLTGHNGEAEKLLLQGYQS